MWKRSCTTAVMASRLVVVLAMVTGLVVSSEVSGSESPVSRTPSVSDRLAELQRVVEQQDQQLTTALALIAAQEALVGQLNDKVADQDALVGQLNDKVADQDALVGQLNDKVATQDQKLDDQDQRLAYQEALIRQLNNKVSDKDVKAADQEGLVAQLKQKLEKQVVLISQLNHKVADQVQKSTNVAGTRRPHIGHSSDGPATDQSSLPTPGSETHLSSGTHDVMARADDAGPLEGVLAALSQQVTEMSADLQALEHSDQQQTHDIRAASSSVFVRWGAAACDNSSQLVYSGVVGGSFWDHSGAATNYLCLTRSPVLSSHTIPSQVALLYGSEYQTFDTHMDHDPVCAVCRSSFPTTLMVPGTNVCSPGWRLLYSGYLMAGYYIHAAGSEYVCVDSSFQASAGNSANQNGKLFYFTVTRCGSLLCPPYENNKVVTCAVCAQ